MIKKKDHRLNSGFTIIETLFVLVIGGIMLILVFQVIPALTRNSRNTSTKDDVQTILSAVNQYALSNSGNFPQACGPGIGSGLCTTNECQDQHINPCPYPNDYFLMNYVDKLALIQPSNISLIPQSLAIGATNQRQDQSPNTTSYTVKIYNYEFCDSNGDGGATISGAGYSDVVALYNIENGNGSPSPQCGQL